MELEQETLHKVDTLNVSYPSLEWERCWHVIGKKDFIKWFFESFKIFASGYQKMTAIEVNYCRFIKFTNKYNKIRNGYSCLEISPLFSDTKNYFILQNNVLLKDFRKTSAVYSSFRIFFLLKTEVVIQRKRQSCFLDKTIEALTWENVVSAKNQFCWLVWYCKKNVLTGQAKSVMKVATARDFSFSCGHGVATDWYLGNFSQFVNFFLHQNFVFQRVIRS